MSWLWPVFILTPATTVTVGFATETDTAFDVTYDLTSVGTAEETDSAFSVTILKSKTVGLCTETDSAFAVTHSKAVRVGLCTETDYSLGVTWIKTEGWPYDDLRPRHLRIEPCAAPIGGGVGLAGREPTIDSGAGYWRIVLGGIPVKTRAHILLWRALEVRFEGRGRAIAIPFFDGKRAPWVSTPGGAISATANAAVALGATSIAINASSAGTIEKGMHFSAGHFGYRIIDIVSHVGNIYTCTIWPKTREAIVSGASLEFRRPVVRCRLETDDGMKLPLSHHRFGEATVAFVEDVPADVI